ncbi:choice-of-anchor A family protein [Kitasatospora sp. NPDC088134]|uniref:choice-of-anchor A family protein n=1 Tax=Kitasatospora sp. NPDC088134 TaxID=3364071 RepID=UPI0037F2E5F7
MTALVATPVLALATIGQADQLAPPLGPCVGSCPNPYPNPPHNGDFAGSDSTVNVYVGGNYRVQGRAAEAEGKIVTVKDLTVDKSDGGGLFNMGVVGVGSRVPPPSGSDFVTVGGAVDVKTGNRIEVGGSDSKGSRGGNLVYGTTRAGTIDTVAPGTVRKDPAAIDAYTGLTRIIEDHSTCMADQTATGTLKVDGNLYTFTGDGTSMRQVFNVDRNIGNPTGAAADLVFAGIPAGATVIVNMVGPDPVLIRTNTGSGFPGDQLTDMRPRLMWNIPKAAAATITGGAQFQGSIMSGNPDGTVTVSTPGTNGRVYLAGNLVQEGSGGTELHAYPFDGDLPVCTTPTPSTSPSDSISPSPSSSPSGSTGPSPSPSESTKPSPSSSASGSTGPSPSPSPSSSPSGSNSPAPSPSSSSGSPSPSGSGSSGPAPSGSTPGTPKPVPPSPGGPSLPSTGDGLVAPAAGAAAVLLALGGGVIALARRGRGRHG